MKPVVPRKGSKDPAGGVRSIEDHPESLNSGCAHCRSSPLWNFQGPVNSTLDDPRTTCSAQLEMECRRGAVDRRAGALISRWRSARNDAIDCANNKGPRRAVAYLLACYRLQYAHLGSGPAPPRSVVLGPMVFRENTRSSRVPAMKID